MEFIIRTVEEKDMHQVMNLCNEIIEEGNSLPWNVPFDERTIREMVSAQSAVFCACRGDEVLGFYILHPNNIGRCGHIANASYGVTGESRGLGVGRELVLHSLERAKELGFIAMQFNAVVSTNIRAITLYQKLGFEEIGRVKNGFLLKDETYVDTVLFYKSLQRI